ncbi:MAG: PqiC family protein [Bacteroidota bacterium]
MYSISRIIPLLLVCLLVQGCVNLKPRENETRFYVLGGQQLQAPVSSTQGAVIGLRRLQLASYLDTPHLVVRRGANEVGFLDAHRWGEDLSPAINRVVAGLMTANAEVKQVDVVPWSAGARHDYVVEISVTKFEGTRLAQGGAIGMQAHLEAYWKVLEPSTNAVLKQGVTVHTTEGPVLLGFPDLVTGLEKTLDGLSADLVTAISSM